MSRPVEVALTALLLLGVATGMTGLLLWWGTAPYECSNCEPE